MPLDLEVGGIAWILNHLRGHLWSTKLCVYFEFCVGFDHKALKNVAKVNEGNLCVQRRLKFLTTFNCIMEYRKVSANANADFHSRLPMPSTDPDKIGPDIFATPVTVSIYLISGCGFTSADSRSPDFGLVGLIASFPDDAISGLSFAPSDFCGYRAFGPCVNFVTAATPPTDTPPRTISTTNTSSGFVRASFFFSTPRLFVSPSSTPGTSCSTVQAVSPSSGAPS